MEGPEPVPAPTEPQRLSKPEIEAYRGALKRGSWRRKVAGVLAGIVAPVALVAGATMLALSPAALVVAGVGMAATAFLIYKSGQRGSTEALEHLGLSRQEAKFVNKPLNLFSMNTVDGATVPSLVAAGTMILLDASDAPEVTRSADAAAKADTHSWTPPARGSQRSARLSTVMRQRGVAGPHHF